MFLIQKYTQYKAAQAEQQKKKVTEKELAQLNHKIDKLLTKLDEHEPETADNEDEECVVCVNAKATMTTYPCAHRVICRKCFVKTIQVAVASRLLPLRCVICRAKVLRLKHSATPPLPGADANWYHVPQSASLYSVTSNTSNVSGVSSVSSCSSASSYKTAGSSVYTRKAYYSARTKKQGYEPLPPSTTASNNNTGSVTGNMTRSATATSMPSTRKPKGVVPGPGPPKAALSRPSTAPPTAPLPLSVAVPPKGKLKLVQDFQREFRTGVHKISQTTKSGGSTRIKCARGLVCQAQWMTRPNPLSNPTLRSVETRPSCLERSTSLERKKSAKWEWRGEETKALRGGPVPQPPPSSISCPSFKQMDKLKHKPTTIPPSTTTPNSKSTTASHKHSTKGSKQSPATH